VVIRIKSQAPSVQPLAPFPAGGDPSGPSPASGSPLVWTGPALGQASPISDDAAALAGYNSPYETKAADAALEEDPELS
jgi:hypothetical protein